MTLIDTNAVVSAGYDSAAAQRLLMFCTFKARSGIFIKRLSLQDNKQWNARSGCVLRPSGRADGICLSPAFDANHGAKCVITQNMSCLTTPIFDLLIQNRHLQIQEQVLSGLQVAQAAATEYFSLCQTERFVHQNFRPHESTNISDWHHERHRHILSLE